MQKCFLLQSLKQEDKPAGQKDLYVSFILFTDVLSLRVMREGGQVRPLANGQQSLPSPDCGLSGHLPLTSPVRSPSGDEQSPSP